MDVWTALQGRARANGGAPLVTYVDPAGGERTELSATSTVNAAAKIANALRAEFDLGPGDVVAVDLPLHWQRSMWCAGVWTAGCVISALPQNQLTDAALVVSTPERAGEWASGPVPVLAVSMHPFGLPITEVLAPGVDDATVLVRQQPDAYLFEPPSDTSLALEGEGRTWTQSELMAAASELGVACGLGPGGRLLLREGAGFAAEWIGCLAAPLAASASVVLVRGAADLAEVADRERTTAWLPTSP